MDEDNTRYLKLTKTRYEPDFREIRFESQVFPEVVLDAHGDPQTMLCRIAIPHPSTETDRKQLQAQKAQDKQQQKVQDACDEACNYVQSVINQHPQGVIMRRGKGNFKAPTELQHMFVLAWDQLYQDVPKADNGDARRAVGAAIFQRFAANQPASGWVILEG